MKTPAFWKTETMGGRLLAPLGWIYYGVSALHRCWQAYCAKPVKLTAPIICIGNATAGGAGKTPSVRMLASTLKIAGYEPHCISRGYGGETLKTPLKIDANKHQASLTGDEPLLLAQTCPTWVSTNRQASAVAAINDGANIILVDDGLQSPSFYKDISLLVMDSFYGIGNGQIIPSGPLREPFGKALKRSDAIILIGDGSYNPQATLPIWRASLETVTDLAPYKEKPVIAFAGIAHPSKFFYTLHEAGIIPLEEIGYADHQAYTPTQLALLLEKAEEHQATLLTTAKDYVKLPESFRKNCVVVDIKLQLEKPKEFLEWLQEKIANG